MKLDYLLFINSI